MTATEKALYFISALTPLHNGSGTGLGLIDNPVIRERHTNFPFIQSSSLKGVLRDEFGKDDFPLVQALFGPPTTKAESHAGAVTFSDARILAFPIRSLKGGFVWATSPLILHRFWRQVDLAGKASAFPKLKALVETLNHSHYQDFATIDVCPQGKGQIELHGRVILEEFPKTARDNTQLGDFATELAKILFDDDFLKKLFSTQLVILNEESFQYFVANATEVTPNIRIGENGTTEDGSLRYTEYLPMETVLFGFLLFGPPKHPADAKLLEEFKQLEPTIKGAKKKFADDPAWTRALFMEKFATIGKFQIGGDETTGKGIVDMRLS